MMVGMQSVCVLLLVLLAGLHTEAKKYHDKHDHDKYYDYAKHDYYDKRNNYWDSPEDKYRRDYDNKYYGPKVPKTHMFITDFGPSPPPPEQGARMARYIVHNADWASIATISSSREVRTFPFANIVSISDGPVSNSSGVPYMYLTAFDLSAQDLEVDNRCSLAMTLAQGDYCKQKNLDPEDPRCAHVILTGKLKKINTIATEIDFAQDALFSRHPVMRSWPTSHNWYFAKIKIEQIVVLDYFGGPKFINLQDYFNAAPQEPRRVA